MKPLAVILLALFVVVTAASAFDLDLGCADDCDRGAPCREACASCSCNPVLPVPVGVFLAATGEPLGVPPSWARSEPLPGVSRAVLHVPLFA